MSTRDFLLTYNGGSGGFVMLHGLLLTGNFHNPYDDSVENIISRQWSNTNDGLIKDWKSAEILPNRVEVSKTSDELDMLYFVCNITEYQLSNHYKDCITVVVYIDDLLMYKISSAKRCNFFFNESADTIYNKSWNTFYNTVKDDSWPVCDTYESLAELPTTIQTELTVKFNVVDLFGNMDECVMREMELGNVFKRTNEYVSHADYAFNLTDVIKTKFKIVTDTMQLKYTHQHKELINNWLALHPLSIQKMLLR